MSKINIPEIKLRNLYSRKRLSSYQIADHFSCSQNTVMERLKSFGIKTRTIQEGKALTKPLYPRKNFCGTKSDKAYLIGFRLGDLHVRKTHLNSPTIQIHANSTKQEQVDLVCNLFAGYGHTRVHNKDKRGARKVRCFVNTSFSFLLPKPEKISGWILESKKSSLAFLAGYIDAEGSLGLNPRGQPFFFLKTQDKGILSAIYKQILPMIEIQTKLHLIRKAGSIMNGVVSNKDVFGIFLYSRENLKKLLSSVLPLLKHLKRVSDANKVLTCINHVRA